MKKSDFIGKLKESIKSGNVLGALTDPNQVKLINKNLDDIQKKLQALGMVQEDIDEALNMGKDYDSQTEFFRDMIDDLMNRYYGVTYYNPPAEEKKAPVEPKEPVNDPQLSLFPKQTKPSNTEPEEKTKPISQMSSEEYNEFVQQRSIYGHNNLFYIVNRIKDAEEKLSSGKKDDNGVSNPLRIPYLALLDTRRTMEEVKKVEENFANSKIVFIFV